MTDEQLAKAERLRDEGSHNNVLFKKCYIEEIPLDSSIADVVISNGVINLSGNKEKVFRESSRILRQGGRMVISDIVAGVHLPESISYYATLWAACIGGAIQKDTYYDLIRQAGLEIEKIQINNYEFISKSARNAGMKYGIQSISLLARKF